ncbi:hypothetical protein ACXR2U_04120 [Jatrophihabitans sp. YIM 134969]
MSTALGSVVSFAERAGDAVVRGVRAAVAGTSGGPGESNAPASGWLVVTIRREPQEIDLDALPGPLAALGDRIETRVRPAAGGKGAELAVRWARQSAGHSSTPARLAGSDPQAKLRSALREAKQLIEVGEVLRVDPTPHGERKATPTGAAVEAATKHAPGGGVL